MNKIKISIITLMSVMSICFAWWGVPKLYTQATDMFNQYRLDWIKEDGDRAKQRLKEAVDDWKTAKRRWCSVQIHMGNDDCVEEITIYDVAEIVNL